MREIESESANATLSCFLLTLVAFSHIRYENPLLAGIMILMAAILSKKARLIFTRWEIWFWVATLSLHIWQRALTPNSFENAPDEAAFSLQHILQHLGVMVKGIFKFNLPYNSIATFTMIGAGIACIFYKKFRFGLAETWFCIIPLIIQMLIVLSHHAGVYDHPTQIRLFIPFAIATSLFAFTAIARYFPKAKGQLLLYSLISLVLFAPQAINTDFVNTLTLNRDIHFLVDFIEQKHTKRILIIYDRPVQFTSLGLGAMTIGTAKQDPKNIQDELKNGLYDHVYLFEETTYGEQDKTWGNSSTLFTKLAHYQQFGDHLMIIFEMIRPERTNSNR